MGGVESSLIQENEIINWSVSKLWKIGFTARGQSPSLEILGDIAMRAQTEDEKNLTTEEIFKNEGEAFLKKNSKIGVWKSGGRGTLHFKDIGYDDNSNVIITLNTTNLENTEERSFTLNWGRRNKWDMFSSPEELLRVALNESLGESKSVASEICRKYRCNKNYNDYNTNRYNRYNKPGIHIRLGGSSNLYKYIINPNTGDKEKVTSKIGKKILSNYMVLLN